MIFGDDSHWFPGCSHGSMWWWCEDYSGEVMLAWWLFVLSSIVYAVRALVLDPIFSRILGPFRGGLQFQGVRQLCNESFSMVVEDHKGDLLKNFERNRRDGPAFLFLLQLETKLVAGVRLLPASFGKKVPEQIWNHFTSKPNYQKIISELKTEYSYRVVFTVRLRLGWNMPVILCLPEFHLLLHSLPITQCPDFYRLIIIHSFCTADIQEWSRIWHAILGQGNLGRSELFCYWGQLF